MVRIRVFEVKGREEESNPDSSAPCGMRRLCWFSELLERHLAWSVRIGLVVRGRFMLSDEPARRAFSRFPLSLDGSEDSLRDEQGILMLA